VESSERGRGYRFQSSHSALGMRIEGLRDCMDVRIIVRAFI
jgi:hypothetical protein